MCWGVSGDLHHVFSHIRSRLSAGSNPDAGFIPGIKYSS